MGPAISTKMPTAFNFDRLDFANQLLMREPDPPGGVACGDVGVKKQRMDDVGPRGVDDASESPEDSKIPSTSAIAGMNGHAFLANHL